MSTFDRTLLGPETAELDAALAEAVAAVNGPARTRLVKLTKSRRSDLLRAVFSEPQGVRQYDAGDPPRRKSAWSVVAVAWWTDAIGRRHVRVRGERLEMSAGMLRNRIVGPTEPGTDALAHLSPDHSFRRRRGDQEDTVAICDCGVAGTPAEVGWMGRCCAACHDRVEAGETPPRLPRLRVVPGSIHALALSPDGTTLAASGGDSVTRLFELATGKVTVLPRESRYGVYRLQFSPDGGRLAGSSAESTIWDLREVPPRATTTPGRRWCGFTDSGSVIALEAATNEPVFLASPGGRAQVLPQWLEVRGVALSPGGALLAVGRSPGSVTVYEVATGRVMASRELWSAQDRLSRFAFLGPAGPLAMVPSLATAAPMLWDLAADTLRPAFGERHWEGAPALAEGDRVLVVESPWLKVWDANGQDLLLSLQPWPHPAAKVAATPDGRMLAVADHDGQVWVWPWETLRALLGDAGLIVPR